MPVELKPKAVPRVGASPAEHDAKVMAEMNIILKRVFPENVYCLIVFNMETGVQFVTNAERTSLVDGLVAVANHMSVPAANNPGSVQ